MFFLSTDCFLKNVKKYIKKLEIWIKNRIFAYLFKENSFFVKPDRKSFFV